MTLKTNIFDTCKEENINGYFCYTCVIEGVKHYIFGTTKEEAFNFMADLINNYNGEINKRETDVREKKVRKVQKDKRSKRQGS